MDNNLTGAAQLLLEIIREAPQYPDAYNSLGVIYEQLGRKHQALQVNHLDPIEHRLLIISPGLHISCSLHTSRCRSMEEISEYGCSAR